MTATCGDVLSRDIMEDAYAHTEKLITRICWKFTEKYGGDFDDWLGEAHLIFMDAARTFDGRSSFITWLWYKLHWGLYNVLRAKSKEQKSPTYAISFEELTSDDNGPEDIFEAASSSSMTTLLGHVSESSRELWELIANPPEELQGQLDVNQPEASWDAVQRYLEWKLRWTMKEMKTAIAELRELCTE